MQKRRFSLSLVPRSPLLFLQQRNSVVFPKFYTSSNSNTDMLRKKENNKLKEQECNISSRCKDKVFNGQPLIDNEICKNVNVSCNKNLLKDEINVPSISPLPSPRDETFDKIFKDKINICNNIFNFSDPLSQLKGKKQKAMALTEINIMLTKKEESSLISSEDQDLLLEMIKRNIFDQDPLGLPNKIIFAMDKTNFFDPSWDQISVVYKILNQFLFLFPDKCDIRLARKAIILMNIPDENERENLVTFLRNYIKVHLDEFDSIWKYLCHAIENVRYGIYSHFCVDSIISLLSIICSLKVGPNMRNYLSKILFTHLLPLFDHEKLSLFYNKLSDFIIQTSDFDLQYQIKAIQFLIKHFPVQNGQKQPLFVSTIAQIIEKIDIQYLNLISNQIFNFIGNCIKSPNSKLVESIITLLSKANMKQVIFANYDTAMEMLYEPLKWSSSSYWEKSIKEQTQYLFSALSKAKLEFIKNKSVDNFFIQEPEDKQNNKKRSNQDKAKIWGMVFRTAARKDNSIDLTRSLSDVQNEFIRKNYDMFLDKVQSNDHYIEKKYFFEKHDKPFMSSKN